MKILLFGKNGQLGWKLQRSLAPLGEVIALDRLGAEGLCGNLEDLPALTATIYSVAPDVLVNAAAYTAVDRAEQEQESALLINAEAPQVMAQAMADLGGLMLHYSTDYVFDGSGDHAWNEDAPTAPLNVYGKTKLQGEQAIRTSGCRHLILRSSWTYGLRGENFIRTMLRLATEREALRIVDDQIGAPTGAELVADVTAHLLRSVLNESELQGVYHLAAAGETSWYAYACFIIDTARKLGFEFKVDTIEPILSSSYRTPAVHPLNSRLDTSRLRTHFRLYLPHWQHGVERMLREIKGGIS